MTNFIVTFNIIAPLAGYMLLGGFFRKVGIMDAAFTAKLNKLLMLCILPCNTALTLYRADLSAMGGQFYVGYAVGGNLLLLLVLLAVYKLRGYEPARLGSIVQGASRGNGVIFGIPLCEAVFGPGNTAIMAIMLAATVPFYNIAHVSMLEICGQKQAEIDAARAAGAVGEGASEKVGPAPRRGVNWRAIALSLLKNSVIWGVVIGLVLNFSGIKLPRFAETMMSGLGSCVTPIAFMMVGASFSLKSAGHDRRDLIEATVIKLVLAPLVFMIIPILQHWQPEKLLAMLVAFAAPTAIISYPMARDAGCDGELAAEIVASTVIVSMFSIFLWIFCFKQAGLM